MTFPATLLTNSPNQIAAQIKLVKAQIRLLTQQLHLLHKSSNFQVVDPIILLHLHFSKLLAGDVKSKLTHNNPLIAAYYKSNTKKNLAAEQCNYMPPCQAPFFPKTSRGNWKRQPNSLFIYLVPLFRPCISCNTIPISSNQPLQTTDMNNATRTRDTNFHKCEAKSIVKEIYFQNLEKLFWNEPLIMASAPYTTEIPS